MPSIPSRGSNRGGAILGKSSNTIERSVILYAAVPMILVLVVTLAWFTSMRVFEFIDSRDSLMNQSIQQGSQMEAFASDRTDEIEAIRGERLAAVERQFWQQMTVASVLLLFGISVPLLASKHIAGIVEQNLNLLRDRLTSGARECSALMPQAFDFQEFGELAEEMRCLLSEHRETGQRWKRAEQELVDTNNDLLKNAAELQQQRKAALAMKAAAELSEQQLKEVNERLELAVKESQLSARQAEIANHAKGDFLATMSHEIRTPLNGVLGFIEILAETDLNKEQSDYVNAIRSSGKLLLNLINDILDFSKIESGHLELEVRRFNLVTALREIAALFFNEATQKGINLRIEIGDDMPREIEGDEVRIRQILTNLLSNAVKFTKAGEVCLFVRGDSRTDTMGLSSIEFEVRDTGIGISQEQLRNLFSSFSQADSSMTRKYGGTGLGLAICKRLAEAMNGKVWATSQVGEGSRFHATIRSKAIVAPKKVPPGHIPLKDEAVQQQQGDQPAATLGEQIPLQIVVAEDEMANRRVLKIVLQRMGWDAVFRENGAELIEYLKDNPCDLIFMDLQMPVMGGLEAAKLIRDGSVGEAMKQVKIIALTANALRADESRCFASGMDGFLTKPLAIDVLRKKIVSLFPLNRAISQ
jgi:signal transduction histidine kinase/CheY-like chemotaxis protein